MTPSAFCEWHPYISKPSLPAELINLTVPREMLRQGTENPPLIVSSPGDVIFGYHGYKVTLLKLHRAKRHSILSGPLLLTKKIQELDLSGFAHSHKLNIVREQTHPGTGTCFPTVLNWTVPSIASVRANECALSQFLSVAQEWMQARNTSR